MGIKKYKKQIIFGVSLTLFICTLISIVLFFIFNNKTIETSANKKLNNMNDIEKTIPNVTEENTTFKISDTKKKVESINISATNRLSDYNLYYCLKFDNKSEINNEDYVIFNDLILLLEENCIICFKYELDGNFSTNAYEINVSNIKVKENTLKVSEKELEKEKIDKKDKTQSTAPYFIRVNYGANVVTIYSKDADGNYTVPYKAMVCSCGKYTPKSGTYKTSNKYVWRPLINNVYGHYATRIVNKILFHSVPYTSASNDTLEYWEYDKLGQTASEGCIRLTVKDAKWIYNNCPSGTMVEFYSDSNPGPLGKPSAQKISSNEECRNWDPTDPNPDNPWYTYSPSKENNNSSESHNDSNNLLNNIVTDSNNTITNDIPVIDNTITDTPIDEPSNDTPSIDNPPVDSPSTNTPSTDNPSVDNPPVNEPTVDEPVLDNPPVNEPTTDNTLTNEIV